MISQVELKQAVLQSTMVTTVLELSGNIGWHVFKPLVLVKALPECHAFLSLFCQTKQETLQCKPVVFSNVLVFSSSALSRLWVSSIFFSHRRYLESVDASVKRQKVLCGTCQVSLLNSCLNCMFCSCDLYFIDASFLLWWKFIEKGWRWNSTCQTATHDYYCSFSDSFFLWLI